MIPIHKVFVSKNCNEQLLGVLNSGKISSGCYNEKFEETVRNYISNDNFISTSMNSILFALQLMNFNEGDEVIVSPLCCLMTTQQINICKLKVVWADVDPLTGSLDPADVEKKITTKTKAIIHYHWSGYPGYIFEINSIGKKYGVVVIEDATSAFGSEYNSKKIGNTETDVVCFSFSPVRLPNAIDGYGLSFNNKVLYEKAKLHRDLGIDRSIFRDELGEISQEYDVMSKGINGRLNEVSSFVAYSQMEHIDSLLNRQYENALKWKEKLRIYNVIYLDEGISMTKPNYWTFSVLFEKDRDSMLLKFRELGLYATKLHLRNDNYSVFGASENLTGVEEFSRKQLCLPCGWWC